MQQSADSAAPRGTEKSVDTLKEEARELTSVVEIARQQTFGESNARIKVLEQKARDLALFVETNRHRTLLESDMKIEALEQKARELANFVETLRDQARLKSEAEIEALVQKARDLALTVETVRRETRLNSEAEIAALGQRARDLAVSVETLRQETLLHSDTEIAALGQQARDLAVCVEAVREETLLHSDTQIRGLEQRARNLAYSVERSRTETLMESDKVIRKLNAELEQRVLERTLQLETANKELEAFSYSVSHDLRAPLRAIDGFSRIVLEDHAVELSADTMFYLKLVRDNTRQMGQLIDDLLAFSRLGRSALAKQTVDVGTLVRQCFAEMQQDQEGRTLEIVIADLPSCQADPTLLKQAWINLLSNALKYTRKCEVARIEIGCHVTGQLSAVGPDPQVAEPVTSNVYFVKDNGAGFDMKYANKLFGVFQRLHRTVDFEGTGVGLAIVQRIVNRHGGRIWSQAQPNVGATFSFTLESGQSDG